jgi:hypothetical protein
MPHMTHARCTHALRQDGWTGLIIAAQNGHEAVVRLLLERGAEVDKATKVKCTQTIALSLSLSLSSSLPSSSSFSLSLSPPAPSLSLPLSFSLSMAVPAVFARKQFVAALEHPSRFSCVAVSRPKSCSSHHL